MGWIKLITSRNHDVFFEFSSPKNKQRGSLEVTFISVPFQAVCLRKWNTLSQSCLTQNDFLLSTLTSMVMSHEWNYKRKHQNPCRKNPTHAWRPGVPNQLGDCSESVGEILLMEERNRANQLRLVVYPILLIRFFSSQVVSRISEPSAVAIVLGLCRWPLAFALAPLIHRCIFDPYHIMSWLFLKHDSVAKFTTSPNNARPWFPIVIFSKKISWKQDLPSET